jgi:isopropylmalate/homocitrate/citramalate synthase
VIKNPFVYEPYPPELVGGIRKIMIGSTSGTEVIRFKVEEALNRIKHVEASLHKSDWRVCEIQKEISQLYEQNLRNSCISDDELNALVDKYFLSKSIPNHSAYGINEDDRVQEMDALPLEVKESSV